MSTSRKRAVSAVVRVIVAGILLVFMVYPIFYVIMSSMKTKDDFRHLPSWALPSAFNIDNYICLPQLGQNFAPALTWAPQF